MTVLDGVIVYWLLIGAVAIFYTLRRLGKARLAFAADGTLNAAQRYQARWRVRSAYQALGAAIAFFAAPVLVLLDRLIPASIGLLTVGAISLGLTLFTYKQIDDDRAHDRLADMLATDPAAEHHRHMDEPPSK